MEWPVPSSTTSYRLATSCKQARYVVLSRTARRHAGRVVKRRDRRDAGAAMFTRWWPKRRRGKCGGAGTRNGCDIPLPKRRVGHAIRLAEIPPATVPLQLTRLRGLSECRFRRCRAPRRGGTRESLTCPTATSTSRPVSIHERLDRRPRRDGNRTVSDPHRTVRSRPFHYARHCGFAAPPAASPDRARRVRTDGFVCPQRPGCPAGGLRFKACSNWPRLATYPCGLPAEPASVTPARADL